MIDKDSAYRWAIEKDLMTFQYRDVISWPRYMDNSKNCEKIIKEIAKTSDSIHKKYARFEDW